MCNLFKIYRTNKRILPLVVPYCISFTLQVLRF